MVRFHMALYSKCVERAHPFDNIYIYIYTYITPALWVTGGLEVVLVTYPLSPPSPRASDPAPLEDSTRLRPFE